MHPSPLASAHLVDDLESSIAGAETPTLGAGATPVRRADVPRELLGKATVPGLLAQAAVEWSLLAALWAAMALAPTWLDVPLIVLVAGRLHALGVILHDATHMPLRGKDGPTRLLEALVGYPIATTLNAMRYHHLRHHRDSGMPSDPYYKDGVEERPLVWLVQWLRGLLLMPFWTVRAPYGLVAAVVPALRPSYARVFLQDKSLDDARALRASPEVIAAARAELGQVLFQIPLVAAFVAWPEVMAWHYAVPATLTGLLASYRVLCEHRYVPAADRRLTTILDTTHDHHLGAWSRLFLAPRNIGFHIVHHIHPQVAQERLPALRRWYMERLGAAYPGGATGPRDAGAPP